MATVRFDRFACEQAQDPDGTDEAFLAFFVDDQYVGNISQNLSSGQEITLGFELEYDSQIRTQLWEVDNPDLGNPHDLLGENTFDTTAGPGTAIYDRAGARYLLEWTVLDVPVSPPPPVTVRRDQASLSSAERTRFLDGINQLIASGIYGTLVVQHSGPAGDFEYRNHAFVPPQAISAQRFLPWHRVYLRRLEEALQQIDPRIFLPYWRGWADRDIPTWLANFTPSVPLPSTLPGQPNPLPVTRNPGGTGTMPTIADVRRELQPTDYTTMSNRLETGSHGDVHVWVGGAMQNPLIASADVLFWLHHCEVDRLWFLWQSSRTDVPSLAGPDRTMTPWTEDVSDTLDTQNMGYTYA